ncbi:TetR/AcrR family transcriptional regulator [Vaginisenegalia massiliensis]|uniref:TetR/AcrR family transcriptional regulator n=1 Tax=Vaginisenegalia massiliensis TaxID=2058294 RepID=UPI000F52AFD1|nr:TetR/AcrR family transcriptional regulator [Vaginisenegalia massiliensis]
MSREGTGEESRRQILEVASRLFAEKGYDNTTIQDIVKGLNGMTKGVIYHHFKSKQDIFEQILELYSEDHKAVQIEADNGLEKIKALLLSELLNVNKQSIGYSGKVILSTPRMIGEQYRVTFEELAPYIKTWIDEGIQDGSIKTEYPLELAELIMLTFNLWLGLQLPSYSVEEAERKLDFFKYMFESMELNLLDEEIMSAAHRLIRHLKK